MKKGLKVALIVVSAIIAVGGICALVCNYISKNWLNDFKIDDDVLFDDETDVFPEIEEM